MKQQRPAVVDQTRSIGQGSAKVSPRFFYVLTINNKKQRGDLFRSPLKPLYPDFQPRMQFELLTLLVSRNHHASMNFCASE